MTILEELEERHLVAQSSDRQALEKETSRGPLCVYAGFDPTGPGLHVGHLLTLMTMRRFARHGHKVIALVGGATAMIGDPSFRTESRPMLRPDQVEENARRIVDDIRQVLKSHAGSLTILNNNEWLSDVGLLEFQRDIGSQFTLSRMLAMESVRGRLDAGQSVTMMEFSYMLLQAADFRHLWRTHGCRLQIGGSDQWGNICNGIELARRTDGVSLFGLTTPLLVDSSGRKMGKTINGAVWLSPASLDHLSFWQFWRNAPDADVEKLMFMFTELSAETIQSLTKRGQDGLNEAKALLAHHVTALVRGSEAAEEAGRQASELFDGRRSVSADSCMQVLEGDTLTSVMRRSGFAKSNSDAGRLVKAGAVRLDGERQGDQWSGISVSANPVLLQVGRKRRIYLASA